jgi:hypothetical protein
MRDVFSRLGLCLVLGGAVAFWACAAGQESSPRTFADAGGDAPLDSPSGDGTAGSAGTGGAGGTGGTAGVGGSAQGGEGGSGATAGAGGTSGTGGVAGTGGAAGEAGQGGTGGATGGTGGTGGGGLDPLLGLPNPSGDSCEVGSFCYGSVLYGCRIATVTEGRCETCYSGGFCGVQGTPCAESDECGTLYQCYDGVCSSICELGVGDSLCDAADCHDVGHATHGVCIPD